MRTPTATVAAKPAKSKRARGVNGSCTNFVRSTLPRSQQPYEGSGCSPHGLQASIVSQYERLLSRFIASMNTTPGSAWSYVDSMIWSHSAPARTVRYTHMSSSRWCAPAARRSGAGGAACTSCHGALSRTAATNASVTATERLKLVRRPSSLAWMNASMSG